MLLVSVRLGLQEALALEAIIAIMPVNVTETLERLVIFMLAHVVDVLALHAQATGDAIRHHSAGHGIHELGLPYGASRCLLLAIIKPAAALLPKAAYTGRFRMIYR